MSMSNVLIIPVLSLIAPPFDRTCNEIMGLPFFMDSVTWLSFSV